MRRLTNFMSSKMSIQSRIALIGSALPIWLPGLHASAASTMPSTAWSLMGAQWALSVEPIARNNPEGSKTRCLSSCSMSDGSNIERMWLAWAVCSWIWDLKDPGFTYMPDILERGCRTRRRTSRNSERSGRMRDGIRSVTTRREGERTETGISEGEECWQAQTTGK